MNRKKQLCLLPWLLSGGLLAGCSDPAPPSTAAVESTRELEDCPASDDWLPMTPAVEMFKPLPHPTTECPFYRGGWQNFLLALEPDQTGKPALLGFPTIDTTFTSRFKHPVNRSFLGDVKQAGKREILIDLNGNSLYYGIHVNEAFRKFIEDNDLKTSDKLQAYPTQKRNLFFPPGLVEFKSAWQIVEGDAASVAAQTAGFVSVVTTVPKLSQDPVTKEIIEDRDTPLTVTVRLLAIHVVYTLPGHPEFIWASFEHTLGPPDSAAIDGRRDVAPTIDGDNPAEKDPSNLLIKGAASDHDFLLYKGGTLVASSNASKPEAELNLVGQKFLAPDTLAPQSTSIYRLFPASKSNTVVPDEAITSLNNNVEHLFLAKAAELDPNDKRANYRLIGAQWMDKPEFFGPDFAIQNDLTSPFAKPPMPGTVGVGPEAFVAAIKTDGSDSPYSILAGEDRMSSTSMESFTQSEDTTFENCFKCHDTHANTANGVPLFRNKAGIKLLDPGLLNVSHVLSQFILEDCAGQKENVKVDPSDPTPNTWKAFCPPFPATGPQ